MTVFYVDSTGGDDNNPGSFTEPWKTIDKVNSSTFNPGDAILFKCGEIWNEQLSIPSSGSSESPILFSSYFVGNKPIINGGENDCAVLNNNKNYIYLQSLNLRGGADYANYGGSVYMRGIGCEVGECLIEEAKNGVCGLVIELSQNCTIHLNDIKDNKNDGIWVSNSDSITIAWNRIDNNGMGEINDRQAIGIWKSRVEIFRNEIIHHGVGSCMELCGDETTPTEFKIYGNFIDHGSCPPDAYTIIGSTEAFGKFYHNVIIPNPNLKNSIKFQEIPTNKPLEIGKNLIL